MLGRAREVFIPRCGAGPAETFLTLTTILVERAASANPARHIRRGLERRSRCAPTRSRPVSTGDRSFYEERLAEDFAFSAPPDPHLDRDGYFVRCWPGAGRQTAFEIVRLIEYEDEVIATYETETSCGVRGRNTEVFTFDDNNRIARIEVYFGWNID